MAFNEAAKHVASRAKPRVPVRSGRLLTSIKPASTQRQGKVAYTSPTKVPYAGFIEFGGAVGRDKSIRRPFVKEGRYLFPAADEEETSVVKTLKNELANLTKRAGLG